MQRSPHLTSSYFMNSSGCKCSSTFQRPNHSRCDTFIVVCGLPSYLFHLWRDEGMRMNEWIFLSYIWSKLSCLLLNYLFLTKTHGRGRFTAVAVDGVVRHNSKIAIMMIMIMLYNIIWEENVGACVFCPLQFNLLTFAQKECNSLLRDD